MFVFTKENATGLVRTAAAYVYAWLLTTVPFSEEFFADVGINEEFLVVLLGTALYQIIRLVAEKLPWVGNFLIINKKPNYTEGTPQS